MRLTVMISLLLLALVNTRCSNQEVGSEHSVSAVEYHPVIDNAIVVKYNTNDCLSCYSLISNLDSDSIPLHLVLSPNGIRKKELPMISSKYNATVEYDADAFSYYSNIIPGNTSTTLHFVKNGKVQYSETLKNFRLSDIPEYDLQN